MKKMYAHLKPYLIVDADTPRKATILAQADSYNDAMHHKVGGYIMSREKYIHGRTHRCCPRCKGKGEIETRAV